MLTIYLGRLQLLLFRVPSLSLLFTFVMKFIIHAVFLSTVTLKSVSKGMPSLRALDICPFLYYRPILIGGLVSFTVQLYVWKLIFFSKIIWMTGLPFIGTCTCISLMTLTNTPIFGMLINSDDTVLSECLFAFCITCFKT